jgi:3-carboxy-cis,cis-muconate cycloisomerase
VSDDLFGPLFGDDVVERAASDASLIRAMLTVESALAGSCAQAGLISRTQADQVAAACVTLDVDLPLLAAGAVATGNPVVPLLEQLRARLPPDAQGAVHLGATSQDIIDTALMLVTRDAGQRILDRAQQAAEAVAALAERHRDTLMVARTLGQQALPTTFGVIAAGWVGQLDTAAGRLAALLDAGLAVQLGGAAGTLAAYGGKGPAVAAALAGGIGLSAARPWHTDRQRLLDVAHTMAGVVVAAAKVATDIVLLAAGEVGEVTIAGGGGSSAMPHKQNPVNGVLVRSAAIRMPGLVATLLAAAVHDHERATGAWHAEWPAWRELLRVTGGACARLVDLLAQTRVIPQRMRATLDATGGRLMAESLAYRLAPSMGRECAWRCVAQLAHRSADSGATFADAVRADPAVRRHLDEAAIAEALDPASWLGSSQALIDAALAAHRTPRS